MTSITGILNLQNYQSVMHEDNFVFLACLYSERKIQEMRRLGVYCPGNADPDYFNS